MKNTIASEGCVISKAKLNRCVIGVRSMIEGNSELDGVICMGADFYETKEDKQRNKEKNQPNVGIGENCHIAKTIIDKDARIGNNVSINVSGNKYEDGDHGSFYCADGIIVIRKGAVIPDNTVI